MLKKMLLVGAKSGILKIGTAHVGQTTSKYLARAADRWRLDVWHGTCMFFRGANCPSGPKSSGNNGPLQYNPSPPTCFFPCHSHSSRCKHPGGVVLFETFPYLSLDWTFRRPIFT